MCETVVHGEALDRLPIISMSEDLMDQRNTKACKTYAPESILARGETLLFSDSWLFDTTNQ
jgi:hypothetical protein